MLEITKYTQKNFQDLLSCMEKLQDYIVKTDPLELNMRTKEYGEKYTNKLLEDIKSNEWIIYMVYDDENCIWCIAWIVWFTEDEYKNEFKYVKMWHIIELFIDENYRGQKLWENLMTKMQEYFQQNNCEYIYVDVFAPNIWAHKFYEKLWYGNRMITMSKKI